MSQGGPHDDTDWWLRLLAFLSFQPGLDPVGRNLLVAEFETKIAWSPVIHDYIFRQLAIVGCRFDWEVVRARADFALMVQCAPLVLADAMVRSGAPNVASEVLEQALGAHFITAAAVNEQQQRWREFGHVVVMSQAPAPIETVVTGLSLPSTFFEPGYASVLQQAS